MPRLPRTFRTAPLPPALVVALLTLGACANSKSAQPDLATPDGRSHASPSTPSTVTPVGRTEEWWVQRHRAILDKAREGGHEVVFLGDSITQGWEGEGKDIWARRIAPLKALNAGISGDRTQHVLQRLDDGLLDALTAKNNHVKAVVVMIGTNNSNGNDNTPAEIAAGVRDILTRVRSRLPDAKILLLAIFPRGEHANDQRDKLTATNALLAPLGETRNITFLDIGGSFFDDQSTLRHDLMPDYVHLSPAGYEIWASAMEPTLRSMLH